MLDDLQIRRRMILKEIISTPLWQEAVKEAKEQLFAQMFATAPGEGSERESLYQESKALDLVLGRIYAMVNELAMLPKKDK